MVVVVVALPEESQFPMIARDLPEATKYALLWTTKDMNQIHSSKIF